MKKRNTPRKQAVKASQASKAHDESSSYQQVERVQRYSNGVGPLQVGNGTEPGDVDVHFELVLDGKTSTKAIGVRVRLSKIAIAVLIIGGVLSYALISHDRELVRDGLQTLKSLFTSGIHMQSEARFPNRSDLKLK